MEQQIDSWDFCFACRLIEYIATVDTTDKQITKQKHKGPYYKRKLELKSKSSEFLPV